jgi:putative ABC transport system permease protein
MKSLVLSALGAALGLLISVWVCNFMSRTSVSYFSRMAHLKSDPIVLLFTLVVSILVGFLFGTTPALRSSRSEGGHSRTSDALAIIEVALAIVLLVGAGLMIRRFERIERRGPGFRPQHLAMVQLSRACEGAVARV